MPDEIELVREAVARTTAAGEAAGLYALDMGMVTGEDGTPVRPFQVIARFVAGERAYRPPVDPEAARTLAVTEQQLERMDVEEIRNPGDDDPLAELERGGA